MIEPRRFGFGDLILLFIVIAAAGGARAWYVSFPGTGGAEEQTLRAADDATAEVKALVAGLKEDLLFRGRAPFVDSVEETAYTSPGYPYLLALLARWRDDWEQTARWAQCGLGALTAGLYFLFARRAFHSTVLATVTGLLCAVYPFWIINTAELDDGVLSTFLLALCIFLGSRGGRAGGVLTSLFFGLSLAGLALVRAALLPFSFVALLWFLRRSRTLPRGWLYALLAFLGFANGLVPWTLRNYQVFGDFMPIVDTTNLHVWIGNNSQATGGPQDEATMKQALTDEPTITLAGLEQLPENERYNKLAGVTWKHLRDDPDGAVRRRLWAGPYFLFGERWFKPVGAKELPSMPDVPAAAENAEEAPTRQLPGWVRDSYPLIRDGTLLGLLMLSMLGWRWTYGWRHGMAPAALAVIWIPLPYVVGHAANYFGPRLPLDGVLLCLAAFAVCCFVPVIGSKLFRGEFAS